MRKSLIPPLVAAAALAIPAAAQAAVPTVSDGSRQATSGGGRFGAVSASAGRPNRLWATVNRCDTPRYPNAVGVRASMPGNGLNQKMYMRFRAQFWSTSRNRWVPVQGRGGRSPWVFAGSARYRFKQAGWNFEFAAPPAGTTFTLRAVVDYQWRKRKRSRRRARRSRRVRWVVARRRTRITRGGLSGVDGGDPPWTSKSMCVIY